MSEADIILEFFLDVEARGAAMETHIAALNEALADIPPERALPRLLGHRSTAS